MEKIASVTSSVRSDVADVLATCDFLPSDEARVLPDTLLERLGAVRAFGLCAKSDHGGAELTLSESNAVISTAATFDASVASALVIHNYLAFSCLADADWVVGHADLITKTASGDALCGFALTEHGAGSAPRNISTTATETPRGFKINGTKIWIGLGSWASHVVCFAKMPQYHNQISAFLVDTSAFGFQVELEHKTMGLRGIVQNTLTFKDVEVPLDRCLSDPANGYRTAKKSMNKGRLGVAAMSIGIAERATQIVAHYVAQRKVGGTYLRDNSYVQRLISEMILRLDVMRRVIQVSEGLNQGTPMSEHMATVAKVICSEWAHEIVDQALQFLGGRGYEEDLLVAKMYRDTRIMRIFEGPTEALLVHLERSFSSRATARSMEETFAKFGTGRSYNGVLRQLEKAGKDTVGCETYRGWVIALSLASAACLNPDGCSQRQLLVESYIEQRITSFLDRISQNISVEQSFISSLIADFVASANDSIRQPDFDPMFMAIKGFS